MTYNNQDEFYNIEDMVSDALPLEGEQKITVTELEGRVSSQKKTPEVQFSYKVDGHKKDDGSDYTGKFDRWLSEGAAKILSRDLFNCGVRSKVSGGVKIPRFNPERDEPEAFANRVAELLAPMKNKSFRVKLIKKTDDRGVDKTEVSILGTATGEALSLGYDAASAV